MGALLGLGSAGDMGVLRLAGAGLRFASEDLDATVAGNLDSPGHPGLRHCVPDLLRSAFCLRFSPQGRVLGPRRARAGAIGVALVALATVLSIAVRRHCLADCRVRQARDADGGRIDGRTAPALHAAQARNSEVQVRFEQAW